MGNVSSEVVSDLLAFLKSTKLNSSPRSYPSIKNALNIFSIPYPFIRIPKGTPLFRIRIHQKLSENLEDVVFHNVQDMGHIVTKNLIPDFGRANEPLQSIFYCSTIRETAFFETSSLARNLSTSALEIYSIGIWEVQKDFNVGTLPLNSKYIGINPVAEKIDKEFKQIFENQRSEGTDDLMKLWSFLSSEFSTPSNKASENDYLITSAFANYVLDNEGISTNSDELQKADGIMYPSVQFESDGLNLALRPELIENNQVMLKQVVCQKMEKVNENEFKETDTLISKSIDYNNYKINW